ncbi:MAG: hypothetical protein EU532_06025 [Promethearchaeota archaeon]|nr:MAG: hypothetical protein EU532_06025 [Candidatus Lokiarchaeota archaeon]
MTKKLFWENSYKTEFEAKIIELTKEGVVLNQTLFYPKSGGQVSDHGFLKAGDTIFEVDYTIKKEDEIIHHIKSDFKEELKIGKIVKGKIDWEYRYGIMKAHTSQHLFSALILNKYNIETSKVYIDFEEVVLELAQNMDYTQLKSVFNEVNSICISDNQKIEVKTMNYEEAKKCSNEIRGFVPEHSKIRLVQIESNDLVCCGGTHVHNSIEIGPLLIDSFKKNREIRYYLGKKAVNMLSDINIDLLISAELLNQPTLKLKQATEKNLNLISNLQQENKNLIIRTLNLISQIPTTSINNISIYIIDMNIENKILTKEFKNFPSNSLLIANLSNNKFRVFSKCKDVKANEIVQYLIEKFGGKGGGSDNSAQCSIDYESMDILNEIRIVLNRK